MRVLIIEDDVEIAELLASAMRRAGYRPTIALDGAEGQEEALINSYGIILLDVMLPTLDGRSVCRNLRRAGIDAPILMLTAKDAIADRVTGLDVGADDYLVKPFDVQELLARIRALSRRDAHRREGRVEVGGLAIDSRAQTVTRNGEPLRLTPREFALLEALARNEGRVLSREAILERVFNNDEALPNTVNYHMSSLRRKVDPEGRLIQTVHGFGYTLKAT